jgi:hypothetical protein
VCETNIRKISENQNIFEKKQKMFGIISGMYIFGVSNFNFYAYEHAIRNEAKHPKATLLGR